MRKAQMGMLARFMNRLVAILAYNVVEVIWNPKCPLPATQVEKQAER